MDKLYERSRMNPEKPPQQRGLLIAVDARVLEIIKGSGVSQPRDDSAVLAELRAYGLQQAALKQRQLLARPDVNLDRIRGDL